MKRFHGSRVFLGYIHEQIGRCLCKAALHIEYTLTKYIVTDEENCKYPVLGVSLALAKVMIAVCCPNKDEKETKGK